MIQDNKVIGKAREDSGNYFGHKSQPSARVLSSAPVNTFVILSRSVSYVLLAVTFFK